MSGRGRGAYYKAKYARGGGSRSNGHGDGSDAKRSRVDAAQVGGALGDARGLHDALCERDGRPYPAYKDVEGTWLLPNFAFVLEHAQADPFAAPSKVSVRMSHAAAGFPQGMIGNKIRRIALADYLARTIHCECKARSYG